MCAGSLAHQSAIAFTCRVVSHHVTQGDGTHPAEMSTHRDANRGLEAVLDGLQKEAKDEKSLQAT